MKNVNGSQSNRYLIGIILLLIAAVLAIKFFPFNLSSPVWQETFTDGELTSNPQWEFSTGGEQVYIKDGKLNTNGIISDESERYMTRMTTKITIPTSDYVEMAVKGRLLSSGMPQEGRSIEFSIWNTTAHKGYHLAVSRGFTGGWPTDRIAISIDDDPRIAIISSPAPVRDTDYVVRAVRQNGMWSLFVNDTKVGSASDTLAGNNFDFLTFGTIGSTVVDELVVKNSP